MALTIFVSSTLRKYVPDYDPMTGAGLETKEKMPVRALCRRMGIPVHEIKMVMVDGVRKDMDYELEGNERVSIFPPVGGG